MTSKSDLYADVVIIGSGVAGAMTAYKLAQKGVRVLVLEAGPRIDRADMVRAFTQTYKRDYSGGYPNVPWAPRPDWTEPGKSNIEFNGPDTTRVEYLRCVGGTTWQWNANCVRFYPVDFRMKSAYGVGADWPISYETIEPFYTEAEYEMGVSGDSTLRDTAARSREYPMPPMPLTYSDKIVSAALKDSGIRFIARPVARTTRAYRGRSACDGFGTCAPICPSGAQYSAIVHVDLAEKAGVKILENARVDRLEADNSGAIKAVHGQRPDGTKFTAKGRIFVVAANGIESPRLLMMSVSERYPLGLANRSELLGRNFMDHPGIIGRILMPSPIYRGRGPQSTIVSYAFRDGKFRKRRPGWLLSVNNMVRIPEIANEFLAKGLEPPELDAAIRRHAIFQLELETEIELLPDPGNGLTLDWDSRDSAGQPKMRLYYRYSDYERAGFKHVKESFARIAKSLKAQILDIADPVGHYHLLGMTKMGDDPKHAVVDAHCRAHDHKNLFVISSSVFPTGGIANPTLTIAALSLRAADEIARQLKGK
ncbi:MAG: GMC family oxidoreductase [Alphaproteobacteria bacterium]|nr:MAG: GMC family oxidoreductase [Alphaproteobacteria bacterium]